MRAIAALLLATGALLAAGCGGSSGGSSASSTVTPGTTATRSSTPGTTATSTPTTSTPAGASGGGHALTLAANPEGQLKYDKTSLTAKAGDVSIAFTNTSQLGHNMTIESSSGKILGATPTFAGGTKSLSLKLKAGTYKFFCSVPGHRMAGMEGTLTVR
jgi:plastocyanin